MSEEKMMILKLLENGKISSQEAQMLLEALGGPKEEKTVQDEQPEPAQSSSSEKDEKDSFFDQEERLEDKFENFTRTFGRRMTQLGTEIADKSVNFAEKMVGAIESMVETGSFQWDFNDRLHSFEEVVEYTLPEGPEFTLNFSTMNGKLIIEPWEEDRIVAKAVIRTQPQHYDQIQPVLTLKEGTNELTFLPNSYEGISMILQVQVPNRIYHTLRFDNKNATITAGKLASRNLYARTKNGGISLSQLKIESELALSSANGKIALEQVSAGSILAATKNAKINLSAISAGEIDLVSSNGKVYLEQLNYLPLNLIKIQTSNGAIQIEDPVPGRNLELEAVTSNAKINVAPEIAVMNRDSQYSSTALKGKKQVEGSQESPLLIKAHTSNASITLFV